ncbi:MAG: sulfur oxidation c-type cytochrome SoxA [Rhodospirillales bacterium]|jgi:sulfur-oxidizing protein SoxA|nr:sulfur oxidation c-type cytochrome SoxA [Rhodospirillaceae bacterium]MDP6429712.1 sulfur oxidation c-type cytochrome SoxA [Rhodospirillales bacterium]MDP6646368.1 sulfur oxidation c-type cytochrome SoxA [Rhodospirillales bacterium]
MKTRKIFLSLAAMIGIGLFLSAPAFAGNEVERRAKDPRNKAKTVGDKASGYVYMTSQTRDMQDDDFASPAFVWVDIGEESWNKVEGSAGKSCASCHGDVKTSMKGVGNKYPKYDPETKKMAALQHIINRERTKRMGAKKWKWESDQMMGVSAYIKLQSRGTPLKIDISGPARPFFEKGRAMFNKRRGLMDMSCRNCHVDNAGNMARSNVLSQAQINGFPTYRMKWQKMGSLHRRFIGCNKNIRAKPYKRGSEEYTNLELYMMWRSSGLKWETPSVRN